MVENDNIFLDSEIEKYAEDSIDIDIDGRKVHLYGNSKITYKNTTITAAYILINWEENTHTLSKMQGAKYVMKSPGISSKIPLIEK